MKRKKNPPRYDKNYRPKSSNTDTSVLITGSSVLAVLAGPLTFNAEEPITQRHGVIYQEELNLQRNRCANPQFREHFLLSDHYDQEMYHTNHADGSQPTMLHNSNTHTQSSSSLNTTLYLYFGFWLIRTIVSNFGVQHLNTGNSSYQIKIETTRWFKYDRDYLCVNKSQFVPVIFEPPCIIQVYKYKSCSKKL